MGMPTERKLSCIPEDANTFEELFSNLDQIDEATETESRASSRGTQSKTVQKLIDQGIF